jgi:DNA-directed RNA polymerase subunit RPC12/RpoP
LAKWQFVNQLPYSTIAGAILTRSTIAAAQGVDLRVLDHFRLDAFNEHSGVSLSLISGAACCGSAESRIMEIASPHLRFCMPCMEEGFHAVLFQFTPIERCPIHQRPLLETCPSCRKKIPYRLDVSFAAHPYACPHCGHRLLSDPTALARQCYLPSARHAVFNWQQFFATYVCWYADGSHCWRDDLGRFQDRDIVPSKLSIARQFDFIGMLQKVLDDPPPLPTLTIDTAAPPNIATTNSAASTPASPEFSRQQWPRFHTKRFLMLYRRYHRFRHKLQQLTSPRHREVTKWWRRSWEGAIARQCDISTSFSFPPFGIAEWASFALLPARLLKQEFIHQPLSLRFEHDLRCTWQAWDRVLMHLDTRHQSALHPHLVPPRACWLASPAFDPGSPALGFV